MTGEYFVGKWDKMKLWKIHIKYFDAMQLPDLCVVTKV